MTVIKSKVVVAPRLCAMCGESFTPNGHRSKWCGIRCILAANCELGPNGCIDWTAGLDLNGYGQLTYGMRCLRAHREAYLAYKGPLKPGTLVRHTCDRRKCINPDHLVPGTHAENTRDMMFRGRHSFNSFAGEKNPMSRLTRMEIDQMRALFADGIRQCELVKMFGIPQTHVSRIIRNESWVDPTYTPPSTLKNLARKKKLALRKGGRNFTAKEIIDIRDAADNGADHTKLAQEHGVSVSTIVKIVSRKKWLLPTDHLDQSQSQ